MGGHSYGVQNGLYGYKTELLEGFREGEVPRWLSADHPTLLGGGDGDVRIEASDSNSEFLRKWRKIAQERGRRQIIAFAVKGTPNTRIRTGNARFGGRRNRRHSPKAPQKIRERCDEYLDSSQHKNEMRELHDHTGEFNGFTVMVTVGEHGGISDPQLMAEYKT